MSELPILKAELRKVNIDLEKFFKLWGGSKLPRYAKRDLKAMNHRIAGLTKEILKLETETPHGIV